MLTGQCLCRSIRFEIDGRLGPIVYCHCSMCRKAQGAAFRSRAKVRAADFRFVSGEELLTFFASSPGTQRGFCRVCGSPIFSHRSDSPSELRLRFGTFDADPGVRPAFHFAVESKAPWHEITDGLPRLNSQGQPMGQS